MQGNGIGLLQGYLKRGVAFAHGGCVFVFAPDDFHAEGLGVTGEGAADVAAAEDGEGFAAEVVHGSVEMDELGGLLPGAGGDVAHAVGQAADEGEQHHEGVLGHAFAAVVAHVAHGNTGGFGGGQVDVVVAGGGHGDEFEPGVGGEVFGADGDFVGDGDLCAGEVGVGLFGRGGGKFVQGVGEVERERAGRKGVAVEEDDVHEWLLGKGMEDDMACREYSKKLEVGGKAT